MEIEDAATARLASLAGRYGLDVRPPAAPDGSRIERTAFLALSTLPRRRPSSRPGVARRKVSPETSSSEKHGREFSSGGGRQSAGAGPGRGPRSARGRSPPAPSPAGIVPVTLPPHLQCAQVSGSRPEARSSGGVAKGPRRSIEAWRAGEEVRAIDPHKRRSNDCLLRGMLREGPSALAPACALACTPSEARGAPPITPLATSSQCSSGSRPVTRLCGGVANGRRRSMEAWRAAEEGQSDRS
jgi:hypothetical protein